MIFDLDHFGFWPSGLSLYIINPTRALNLLCRCYRIVRGAEEGQILQPHLPFGLGILHLGSKTPPPNIWCRNVKLLHEISSFVSISPHPHPPGGFHESITNFVWGFRKRVHPLDMSMRKVFIMRAVFLVWGGSVGRYSLARKVSSLRLSFFLSVFVPKNATPLLNIPGTVADHNPLSRGGPLVAFFLPSQHTPRLSHRKSRCIASTHTHKYSNTRI